MQELGSRDPEIGSGSSKSEFSVPELYLAIDARSTLPPRSRRLVPTRSKALRLGIWIASFMAGVGANAAFLHLGARSHGARVVIGEKVLHQRTSPQRTLHVPPSPTASLAWAPPVLVDRAGSLQSISCPTSGFCAAVDGQGQALQYMDGKWSPPAHIDGDRQLTSVSCTAPTFCLAVDEKGDAVRYDGTKWSAPERVDRTTFPELTTVSCSSPVFCAAMDRDGNGLIYNGTKWSGPQQVDPGAWSPISHDAPSVSCPTDGFCVGVDAQENTLFYATGSWQTTSPAIPPNTQATMSYDNTISCSSSTFCVASQNPGQLLAYDGTQWSAPITVDPSNYLTSISCVTTSFCAAVDSLLPTGYNNDTADGNGQVAVYNGTNWSSPQLVNGTGIVSGISCASSTFCAMIDKSGDVLIGMWRSGRPSS